VVLEALEQNNQYIYFENFNIQKNQSIGITCVFSSTASIPSKIYSHKGSWARIIQNQLIFLGYKNTKILDNQKDNWNDFDNIIIDHGMEYSGTYNLFSGLNDSIIKNLIHFINYKGNIFSLTHDIPDFSKIVENRLNNNSTSKNVSLIDLNILKEKCGKYKRFDFIHKSKTYLIGDSHAHSIYETGDFVHRNNGFTLYGTLKKRLKNILIYNDFNKLKLYFGNIDIRHHLMRKSNPEDSLKQLLKEYENQLLEFNTKDIEVSEVLPIENILRKIPQTGYYKGTPYYGTWEERTNLVKLFNSELKNLCEKNNWSLYKHPLIYKNNKGELDFKVMEKPQSIHISREFYRWNFESNKLNNFNRRDFLCKKTKFE